MKLVEVTRGLQTSDETYARAMEFGKALGQVFVTTRDTPGFILNHFIVAFNNDCIRAYENGLASIEDIDKAVKLGLGYPIRRRNAEMDLTEAIYGRYSDTLKKPEKKEGAD